MARNVQLKGTIREAITLAIPIIIANTAWTLLSVADTAFVGRLGTDPLAAIGIISSLDFLFAIVLFALGSSSQIAISRFQGGQQTSRIPHVFWNSILMLLLTGFILSVVAFVTVELVLPHWISSFGVLSAIKDYMRVKIFSYRYLCRVAGFTLWERHHLSLRHNRRVHKPFKHNAGLCIDFRLRCYSSAWNDRCCLGVCVGYCFRDINAFRISVY